jgi:diguanylate cyclase (GGDEF)-like protein/PAS domain S-box-containing protein
MKKNDKMKEQRITETIEACRHLTQMEKSETGYKLAESEELYKTLAESSFAAVFIVQEGKFSFINTSAIAYAGYSAEEFIGQDSSFIVHPEEREKVKRLSREMLSGTRNAAFEFRMVTKQNNIRWISQTVAPIQYGGKPAILGNALDVTDLKQAEELYKTLTENSFAAVFIVQEGKFSFINTSAIAYAGYSAEEFIGQDSSFIVHPEDREKVKRLSKEMLSGTRNAAFDFRMVTKQSNIRWISQTVTPIQYGGKPAILGNALDVTDLKQAEEALRESERLQSIILGSPFPTFAIGRDHEVMHWNKAMEELSGIKAEAAIGTIHDCLSALYGKERPCMAYLLLDGIIEATPQYYSGKYVKSGLTDMAYEATDFFPEMGEGGRWLRITATAVRSSKGDVIGAIETLEDVTEKKRMEEALRESAERYRELSIIDALTQLYNSRYFYNQLKMEIDRVNRYEEQPMTLILLDLDNFKAVNDTYGHIEGDQVLSRLGQVIKRCMRKTDSAYRYGGEEFTILLPMTTSKNAAVAAERIRTEFKKENFSPAPGKEFHMTVSIGLAQYKPQEDMKVFVHRVDQLMYQAKEKGKDRVCSET